MKRVHILNGLKQRLNNIIGTSDATTPDPTNPSLKALTAWSVQAAMISNLQRVVKGLVGGSDQGRVLGGLEVTKASGSAIEISSGVGITSNGNVVNVDSSFIANLSTPSDPDGFLYISIRHKMAVVPGSDDDGNETNFVGKTGSEEMVYDDYAASKKETLSSDDALEIVVQNEGSPSIDPELIYLGRVAYESGSIKDPFEFERTRFTGFSDSSGNAFVKSINAIGDDDGNGQSVFNTNFVATALSTFTDTLVSSGTLLASGTANLSAASLVNLPSGAGELQVGGTPTSASAASNTFTTDDGKTVTVTNGIITDIV